MDGVKETGHIKQREEPRQSPGGGREPGALEKPQEGQCLGVRGTFQAMVGDEAAAMGPSEARSIRSFYVRPMHLNLPKVKGKPQKGFKQRDDVIPSVLFRRIPLAMVGEWKTTWICVRVGSLV